MLDNPALYFAGVLALGIAAQWFAWRLRVPAIVLLLAIGFLFGYLTGPPARYVSPDVLYPAVSMAVGLILFEGGLSLRFRDIRATRGVVLRLVTVGLAVTWLLVALAAYYLLGLSIEMATLLGALLTVSGPTVIIPLVRNIHLNRRIGSIVKWEGIVNDPIGAGQLHDPAVDHAAGRRGAGCCGGLAVGRHAPSLLGARLPAKLRCVGLGTTAVRGVQLAATRVRAGDRHPLGDHLGEPTDRHGQTRD